MDHQDTDISNIMQHELAMDKDKEGSKDDLIAAIADKVLNYLDGDAELLFSYLYRLDIEESKIKYILSQQDHLPTHMGLAHLIYDRQMERIQTKKSFKQEPIEGWDDW